MPARGEHAIVRPPERFAIGERGMTDVAVAGESPRPQGGSGARFGSPGFALMAVSVVLAIVGSNVAVGAFLWSALDSRLNDVNERINDVNDRLDNVNRRLDNVNERLDDLNTRVSRIEGKLGLPAPER